MAWEGFMLTTEEVAVLNVLIAAPDALMETRALADQTTILDSLEVAGYVRRWHNAKTEYVVLTEWGAEQLQVETTERSREVARWRRWRRDEHGVRIEDPVIVRAEARCRRWPQWLLEKIEDKRRDVPAIDPVSEEPMRLFGGGREGQGVPVMVDKRLAKRATKAKRQGQ